MDKAIVLVSGGLDSAVSSAWAARTFGAEACIPINFAYGQRHARELVAGDLVCDFLFRTPPRTFNLQQVFTTIGGSSLTSGLREGNPSIEAVTRTPSDLPPTFVPGRNILMLSIAAALGYTEQAYNLVGGWNVLDYSGYPDCRPEFFDALEQTLDIGLGLGLGPDGVSIKAMNIHAPLVRLTKVQIIQLGIELRAPLAMTWSCYAGGSEPCGVCDSCKIRAAGFAEVGMDDPATDFYKETL